MNRPILRKFLVEDCYKLCLGNFGKGLLYGKQGIFTLKSKSGEMKCEFKMEFANTKSIQLFFQWNKKFHKQTIYLECETIPFGVRPYLLCGCGHRANTLYFRPSFPHYFACRQCLNLNYEITTIHRESLSGGLRYQLNRRLLLCDRKRVRSISYKNKMTRRAIRFIKMSCKWWLKGEARMQIERMLDIFDYN